MPTKVLEAFVKLFADQKELNSVLAGLPAAARKAGTKTGLQFSEGLNQSIAQQVTPKRVGGRGFVPPLVGGRGVDLSSPFSRGFQQFKTARDLATLTGAGPGPIVPGGGGGRGGADGGGGLGGVLGSVVKGTRAGGLGGVLGRLAPAFSNPVTAGITVATAAVLGYVSGVKQAVSAERELAKAREAGDLEGVAAIYQKASQAVKDYDADVLDASDSAPGFEAATRRALAGASIAWATLSGRGIGRLTKEAEAAKKAAEEMWRTFGAPKLATEALKRQADEMQRSGELALAAATDTFEYNRATDQLIASKERAAAAEIQSINAEMGRIRLDLVNKKITEAEATDRLRDAEERRGAVGRKLAQDEEEINTRRRRQLAEMEAAEIEHGDRIAGLQRQRRDAIVSSLGQIVEAESATNLSLARAFQLRAGLLRDSTANAIDSLEKETAARREALKVRIAGSQGDERVKLERDLTALTEEETTKRTEIITRATEQAIQLAQKERQERIDQATQLFSIQQTLGRQTLADELARQTAIAQGAQAGSKVQLQAVAQVAALIKQTSDQARAFVNEALSASDALARKAGVEGPAFVSRSSLATDAATRLRQLQEAQDTLNRGGSIAREDAAALSGGELDRLLEQRRAGIASLARRSVDEGQSFGDFQRSALTGTGSFEEQIGQAFKTPADLFRDQLGQPLATQLDELTAKASGSFTELTTRGTEQFQALEAAWAATVQRMIEKTNEGTSEMGQSILRMVTENLARSLRDLERRS